MINNTKRQLLFVCVFDSLSELMLETISARKLEFIPLEWLRAENRVVVFGEKLHLEFYS